MFLLAHAVGCGSLSFVVARFVSLWFVVPLCLAAVRCDCGLVGQHRIQKCGANGSANWRSDSTENAPKMEPTLKHTTQREFCNMRFVGSGACATRPYTYAAFTSRTTRRVCPAWSVSAIVCGVATAKGTLLVVAGAPPSPSTHQALCHRLAEVGRHPAHSTRYGCQQKPEAQIQRRANSPPHPRPGGAWQEITIAGTYGL